MKRIDEMMELKAARLRVDLADLREFDSDLAERCEARHLAPIHIHTPVCAG
mgnify:CR=1 FL=1